MADINEYSRRNLNVAKAVGACANARHALGRVEAMKHPPKWLVKSLNGIIERTEPLGRELANYRNEVSPYKSDVQLPVSEEVSK